MDTSQIVWIIVAVVVVLIIIGIIARMAGRKKAVRNREEAGRIRAEEQETQLQARERENSAQRAKADADAVELKSKEREIEAERLQAEAKNAEVAAERKRMDAEQQSAEAHEQTQASEKRLRHADKLDPDVGKDGSRAPVDDAKGRRVDGAATTGGPVDDRGSHEGAQRAGTAGNPVAGTRGDVHGDRADRVGEPVQPGRRQDAAPVVGEPQATDRPDAYGEAAAQRTERRGGHNDAAVDGLDAEDLDAKDIDPKGRHGDVPKHRD